MASGFFERAEAIAKGNGCGSDGWRFFNFGDEGGADDGGIGEAAENGDMAGKRNAEADGDGKLRDAAGPPEEGGQIIGQDILRAGDAGAGDEIEKTGGAGSNFREAFVRGSGRAEEDGIEMMCGENAAIVFGFFGREIGDENAISASGCGSGCEFFEPHLENGIVIAEEDERDFVSRRVRLADAANQIEDASKSRAGFQSALGGTLDRGAIGKRVAEG